MDVIVKIIQSHPLPELLLSRKDEHTVYTTHFQTCREVWNFQGARKLQELIFAEGIPPVVKTYFGVLVRPHHIDPRLPVSPKKQWEGVIGGTSTDRALSGLYESWWSDATACYCYLRDIQDSICWWETPRAQIRRTFRRSYLPIRAKVEHHLVFCKRQSEASSSRHESPYHASLWDSRFMREEAGIDTCSW